MVLTRFPCPWSPPLGVSSRESPEMLSGQFRSQWMWLTWLPKINPGLDCGCVLPSKSGRAFRIWVCRTGLCVVHGLPAEQRLVQRVCVPWTQLWSQLPLWLPLQCCWLQRASDVCCVYACGILYMHLIFHIDFEIYAWKPEGVSAASGDN